LFLTNDNDKDLRVLAECIQEETENSNGWCRLGALLLAMGQSEMAQQVYEIILEQTTNESEKAATCNQIGWAKYNLGQYEEAITCYEQSL
jgi:tetratricopeptide (TPR) repeat protein